VLRDNMAGGAPDHQFNFVTANGPCIPLVGDWDGDGVQTIGLYSPSVSAFYLTNGFKEGRDLIALQFGPANGGWLPVVGDWNGDGTHSVGLYNPAVGHFYLRNSLQDGWDVDYDIAFGPERSQMIPLAGDWDGSGRYSVGLYDRDAGAFHLRFIDGSEKTFSFGPKNVEAVPFSAVWF
jgi:hypothetical protein